MHKGDYQIEFLESIKLVVSKRIIKSMISKIIEDCNEQKLRQFIIKLTAAYQSNIELFVKTDETMIYDLILNMQISDVTFQPIYDFLKLFKVKYQKERILTNANFLSQNVENYFIIKSITKNYEFDIKINEGFVTDFNASIFEELFLKIIENCKDRECIRLYLYNIQNKKLTEKLLKTVGYGDSHTTRINYMDLGCHINSEGKHCKICKKYIDLPLRYHYEGSDVLPEINNEINSAIIKQNFATVMFYFEHYKETRTINFLENIVRLVFTDNFNNKHLFRIFTLLDFSTEPEMEKIIEDLFCYISNNRNLRQYENCLNILLNINLTDKLAISGFKLLYHFLKLRNNQFTKLIVNHVIMKHLKIFRKSIKEILEHFIIHKKENITEVLNHMATVFDLDYTDFIDKELYDISNVLYNVNGIDYLENEFLDKAYIFVSVEKIVNKKDDGFDFFGYSSDDFVQRFACKLFPLLLIKRYDLFTSKNIIFCNCKILFMKNIVGVLFNLRMYYKNDILIDMPCIFDIFIEIFKFLDEKIMLFFNHLLPFIEYFSINHQINHKSCSQRANCSDHCLQEFYNIIKQKKSHERTDAIIPYFENEDLVDVQDMSLIFNRLMNLINLNNKSLERIKGSIFDKIFWDFIINHKNMYLNRYNLVNQKNLTNNSNRRKIADDKLLVNTTQLKNIFGTENIEIKKLLIFYLLNKYNVEDFNNYFNGFYTLVCERFIDNHKLFNFLGSVGANKIIATKQTIRKYLFMSDFTISSVAVFLIENFLIDFNYDMQDIYFFIIQETLKFVDNKLNIQMSTYQFIKHFEDTKYYYNFEFKPKNGNFFRINLRYREFLIQFLSIALVVLLENNQEMYFNLLKYGIMFHTTAVEFYSLCAGRLLVDPIKKELLEMESETINCSLHKIDSKVLKFIVKLNVFCKESIISEPFLVRLCIHLEEYHLLLRIYEAKYKEDNEHHLIIQSLYYLISDHVNCLAMNKIPKTISSVNIFFDLCYEKDLANATECFKNIICNEIEGLLLERIIQQERHKSNCIESYTEINFEDFDKILSSWDSDIDNQLKMNILHLNYDFNLLKNQPIDLSLIAIEQRRNVAVDKGFFIRHHARMIDYFESKLNNVETKAILHEHRSKLQLESIKVLRRNKNFIRCKELITRMVLAGQWSGLYEDAKLKATTGKFEDACFSLERLHLMIEPSDFIYQKTINFLAKLKNDRESYLEYLQKLPSSEKLHFRYAKFLESIDQLSAVDNYLKSYFYGVKYTNYIIPRVIHLICEVSDDSVISKKCNNVDEYFRMVYKLIYEVQSKIDYSDWIPYFNHILSKVTHKNESITTLVAFFLTKLITLFPEKVLWHSIYHLTTKQANILKVISSLKEDLSTSIKAKMIHYINLSKMFLSICSFDSRKKSELSMEKDFKINLKFTQNVVIPNSGLNCNLIGFEDRILVFNSLQSPKRVTLLGDDGKRYHILCKPNDDLRKDIRFMDINRTLNDVFSNHPLCQQNKLYIRTYSVFALNSNNGIIEWINGLVSLKSIIDLEYQRIGKSVSEEQRLYRAKKKMGVDQFINALSKFPSVLSLWFDKFRDPSEYYESRQRFIQTYAVMNIVGWFMGLGDRHLENIMIDSNTADTFHVDLNCLFDNARRFEIPERVPFRLTQNIIDAFGPLNIEGTYRRTAEVCLKIMIEKKDLIITNLLSFVYDPVDNKAKKNQTEAAKKMVNSLVTKLDVKDVEKHVSKLIEEATNEINLANMYIGWASFV